MGLRKSGRSSSPAVTCVALATLLNLCFNTRLQAVCWGSPRGTAAWSPPGSCSTVALRQGHGEVLAPLPNADGLLKASSARQGDGSPADRHRKNVGVTEVPQPQLGVFHGFIPKPGPGYVLMGVVLVAWRHWCCCLSLCPCSSTGLTGLTFWVLL